MERLPNLTILIPCLNEAHTIKSAVIHANQAGKKYAQKYEILVIDNGSTDNTSSLLKKQKIAKVISVPIKGYGAALHYGILSSQYPYIFFADADLSYDFGEIYKFIKHINNGYDLILGSRYRGKINKNAMPLLNRYFGTPVLTFFINVVYGIKTSDCNSGMRVIKKSFYRKLSMKNSGMEWASELLIKTALKGGRYYEVPIHFSKDQRTKSTHLKRWEDGWRHLKVIILLKPQTLIFLAIFVIIFGLIILKYSLFTTLAMFLFAEFLILSFCVAMKLSAVIDKKDNRISLLINKLPLVLIGAIITLFGIINLIIITDAHLFTKYIILFQVVLFDLWLFFIETINTHLVNPLKDDLDGIK